MTSRVSLVLNKILIMKMTLEPLKLEVKPHLYIPVQQINKKMLFWPQQADTPKYSSKMTMAIYLAFIGVYYITKRYVVRSLLLEIRQDKIDVFKEFY